MTRTEAEALFGPIKVAHNWRPIPLRYYDWEAYFDRYLDNEMPYWTRAVGATEAEAIANLLEQAAEHHAERVTAVLSQFIPYNVCSSCGNRMCEHAMCSFCEGCPDCMDAADEMHEEMEGDNGESREYLNGMDLLGRNL